MHLNSDLDAVSAAETRFICFVQNCWNCPSWCQWLLKIFRLLGNLARWVISFFVLSCYWFQDFFNFFLNLEFSLSTSFFQSSDLVQLCFSSAHLHPAFGEPCPVCIWKLLSFESPGVWLQCRWCFSPALSDGHQDLIMWGGQVLEESRENVCVYIVFDSRVNSSCFCSFHIVLKCIYKVIFNLTHPLTSC